MKKRQFPIGFIGLFLTACTFTAELPSKAYPMVETSEPLVSSTGVTFRGTVTNMGSQPILYQAFVWGVNSMPTLDDKIVYVKNTNLDGPFIAPIQDGLQKRTYWVRAVLITQDYDVYGKPVEFHSVYASEPTLTEISPKYGYPGDKIVLKGKNLAVDSIPCKVFLGSYELTVDSYTDEQLVVRYPTLYKTLKAPLKLLVTGRDTMVSDSLELRFPWTMKKNINFLTDLPATFSCGNFGYVISRGSYFMYVYEPAIDKWTARSLPAYSGGMPVINQYGNYVPQESNVMAISAGDKAYVFLNGMFWEYTPATSTWIRKADFPGLLSDYKRFEFEFFLSGNVYVGSGGVVQAFWEYDPATNQWTQKADFPDAIPFTEIFGNFAFTLGNAGYVGVTCNPQICNMYAYDPTKDQWNRKKNVPIGNLHDFSGFAIDGVGFAGLGMMSNGIFNDLLKYDETTDSWKKCHMNPSWYDLFVNGWMVINKKAYIFVPASGYNYGNCYVMEFDPAKD
jgi:hypothetical protein